MSLGKAFLVVVASAVVFAALGGTLGYLIGAYMPGYYRSVFENGGRSDFSPVEVGVGQGTTQGVVGGVVVGLALVGLTIWRGKRSDAGAR
jgi:hypothetical protein